MLDRHIARATAIEHIEQITGKLPLVSLTLYQKLRFQFAMDRTILIAILALDNFVAALPALQAQLSSAISAGTTITVGMGVNIPVPTAVRPPSVASVAPLSVAAPSVLADPSLG